jgi:hypothetical protein
MYKQDISAHVGLENVRVGADQGAMPPPWCLVFRIPLWCCAANSTGQLSPTTTACSQRWADPELRDGLPGSHLYSTDSYQAFDFNRSDQYPGDVITRADAFLDLTA